MAGGPRPVISIVTTCKGRLAFLKRALPQMLATGLPTIVVDFDCPQGTRGFLAENHPAVRVAAVDDKPGFNAAMARNVGAQSSTSDMILFLDCDVVLSDAFAGFLDETEFSDHAFFTCDLSVQDLTGSCLVSRSWFDRIGGYDEMFTGWGYEDVDLYRRLEARGLQHRFFPPRLMAAIPHSDAIRLEFRGIGNKWAGQRLNSIYSDVKLDIEGAVRRPLSPAERQEVRKTVSEALHRARMTGKAADFSVRLKAIRVDATPDLAADIAYSLARVFHYTASFG